MSGEISIVQLLITIVTGTVIPVVVLWLQQVSWPGYYKFGLAAALSVIAATLMAYSDGKLTTASLVNDFATIFTVSQTVYFTFFRALNLHKFIYPQDVLVNQTKDEVAKSIEGAVNSQLARDILDVTKPDQLSVEVNVTEAQG
jgi:hypothetical protein